MALAEPLPEPGSIQVEPETGSTLTVDLSAIEENWRTLSRQLVDVECGAVVKANAYGLGLEAVTAKLAQAGCKTFFVADLMEARRVRARAPEATTYVLNGFLSEAGKGFIEVGAQPTINSLAEFAEWEAFRAAQNWRGHAALHVDTGMNRLGISVEEAAALALRIQSGDHGITLVMSHLACAESPDHPLTAKQIGLFREIHLLYRDIPASLVNSSGVFLSNSVHYDLARPGAALYGINPTPGRPNPMRNVVELTGRILQVRFVERGETVGYGATWQAKRNSRIAVAALGYADGILRTASGTENEQGGAAIIAENRCPIVGRISMDLVCLDVTDLPDGAVRRGGIATFIGNGITVDDFAASAKTIGYEVLTRLGTRSHLVYRDTAAKDP